MSSNCQVSNSFEPPFGLRSPHVQTILSSVGPRKIAVAKRFKAYAAGQQKFTLNCGTTAYSDEQVHLEGYFNQASAKPAKQMAILVHGWEGSHQSSYMMSMTTRLLENGIDVFRLNLRDHGDTHHLNRGIFNSTMLEEVINGVEDVQKRLPYENYHLAGFSLGGNFCLRLAANAHDRAISLSSVSAFCPAIHAAQSNDVLNQSENWVYGRYFVRKWKRSLRKKIEQWPDYTFGEQLERLKTLDELNDAFIPTYTPYDNVDEYFDAYAISGDTLDKTIAPCYLHFAEDDMIIPVEGVKDLSSSSDVHVYITKRGGHCGFMNNWRGDSWQDQRVLEIIQQSSI